jgi:hypothetical protein
MREGRWAMVTLPFAVVSVRGNELVLTTVVAPAPPQAVLNANAIATASDLVTVNLDTGTSSFSLGKKEGLAGRCRAHHPSHEGC